MLIVIYFAKNASLCELSIASYTLSQPCVPLHAVSALAWIETLYKALLISDRRWSIKPFLICFDLSYFQKPDNISSDSIVLCLYHDLLQTSNLLTSTILVLLKVISI